MSVVRLGIEALYEIPKDMWPSLKEIFKDLKLEESEWQSVKEVIADIDDIPEWLADLKGIYIKPLKEVRFVNDAATNLKNMSGNSRKEVLEFVKTVNQIVFPGYELLSYKTIAVFEDACTDRINELLNDGWRIIAVMPQPQQRRPDYIMVHTEINKKSP